MSFLAGCIVWMLIGGILASGAIIGATITTKIADTIEAKIKENRRT